MGEKAPPFAVYPGGQPGQANAVPGHELEELWFQIARIPWASVVLVPVGAGGSAADIATALAQVGTRLRDTPVTAIVADSMDYASARALAEMQPRLHDGLDWADAIPVETEGEDARSVAEDGGSAAPERAPEREREPQRPDVSVVRAGTAMPPFGRAIISIRAVVDEPVGVAVAQAADAVVLCVQLGGAHLAAARRTIELIGRERIIGALLLR